MTNLTITLNEVLVLIAIVLGIVRLAGVKNQSFQAIAHLYVGYLVGVYCVTYYYVYLLLVIGLSVLEVCAFLYFKRRSKLTK